MAKEDVAATAEAIAAIRAYFARSRVLNPRDVSWGTRGGSGRLGRRYSLTVVLTHLPSGIEVRVGSDKPGGRTRAQNTAAKAELYLECLKELERKVLEERRAANRRNAVRRHR